MASTFDADRLTRTHRRVQRRLGQQTAVAVAAAWGILDLADLDGTTDRWLQAVVPLISGQRRQSAALAANYYRQFRILEGIGDITPAMQAAEINRDVLATSMRVVGPVSLKRNVGEGVGLDRAVDIAQSRVTGAAVRHTVNGGRAVITRTVDQDRAARGWARTTSGSPCSFCAMLSSRGAAYKGERTAVFQAHDSCGCSAEPIYHDDAEPPEAAKWRTMWNQAVDQTPAGEDTAKVFRQLMESTPA
jgi:hypothetical protein